MDDSRQGIIITCCASYLWDALIVLCENLWGNLWELLLDICALGVTPSLGLGSSGCI